MLCLFSYLPIPQSVNRDLFEDPDVPASTRLRSGRILSDLPPVPCTDGVQASTTAPQQDYTYDERHRAGARNQLADALSRNSIEEASSWNRESWILFSQRDNTQAQCGDKGVVPLIDCVTDTRCKATFVLRDGTLYRRHWANKRDERHLLVIPGKLRSSFLRAIHDNP